jgi:hypothetical protein
MSDTQTRLDAVKLAEWREHVRLLRNEPSIHMNHDDLLMFIDELERVTAALREAALHQGLPKDAAPERIGAHFRNNRELRQELDRLTGAAPAAQEEECPADHGDSCCGYPAACREALARAAQEDK